MSLALTSNATTQTTGSLDAGVSWIDYADYLGTGAYVVSPSLRYNSGNSSLGVSGTYVGFESGSRILQGLLAGSWISPRWGDLNAELFGSTGLSVYQDRLVDPVYSEEFGTAHLRGGTRIHWTGRTSGAWIMGAVGETYGDSESTRPYEIGIGLWSAREGFGFGATLTRTKFQRIEYVDIVGMARWSDPHLIVDGSLGLRGWSDGGGAGVYGEIRGRIPLWERVSLMISGGRNPSDPPRGILSANYVSAGVRIDVLRTASPTPAAPMRALLRELSRPRAPEVGEARLSLFTYGPNQRTIRITAPGASTVELFGDFTDWQPIVLNNVGEHSWEWEIDLSPGVYRVNIRLDNGEWIVPNGLRAELDDFGSSVGILVVR